MSGNLFARMAVIFFALAFTAISCDKEDEETVKDADIATLTDEAVASYLYNDIFSLAGNSGRQMDQLLTNQEKFAVAADGESCPVITITPFNLTDWLKTVVLDFGEGCALEGITKSGKIIITVTDWFWRDWNGQSVLRITWYLAIWLRVAKR